MKTRPDREGARRNPDFFRPYPSYGMWAQWVARLPLPRPRLTILLYHSICPDPATEHNGRFNITLNIFRAQMRWLVDNGYETISPEDIAQVIRTPSSRKKVLLTFDDGYRNTYEYALPILRDAGLKACIFISTAYIDSATPFPWITCDKSTAVKYYMPMSSAQIKELAATEGMSIGAHTVTHQRLARLPAETADAEIRDSIRALVSVIERSVTHFSYPYGAKKDFTERDMALCQAAGLHTAMTTAARSIRKSENLFSLPRLTVYEKDAGTNFALKVEGFYDLYDLYRRVYLYRHLH
ncbi:MAG: polysaccharide deacetylase family protein [Spartobacteria bacterium]|nr:polysaccharide deacetylase family protein [Spartobacteria bacterium]